MVSVVAFGHKKRLECGGCNAILEYVENEVRESRYTCMGDPSGHKYVICPNCGQQARIPGSSW